MGSRFAALIGPFRTLELAEKTGVHKQTVSRWKTCRLLPGSTLYERIASATGRTIDEIAEAVAADKAARTAAKDRALAAKKRRSAKKGTNVGHSAS